MTRNPAFMQLWLNKDNSAVPSKKALNGILAGGITGAIDTLITYPTEYLKTQLQLDSKSGTKNYNGLIDCMVKTYKQFGIRGFYRGLTVLLVGAVPKSAVRFGTFEILKENSTMKNERGTLTSGGRVLCGLGAGVCEGILVITPMETLKVKFIDDMRKTHPRYKGFLHGVALIIKEEGLAGIYKGLLPTVLKQGSNQAVRWYTVETLKLIYKGDNLAKPIPVYLSGLIGVIAGIASVYANTPIDVIKTRMQGLEAKKYKGTLDCIITTWKEEGPFAFYKGTVPRLGRVCLDVGISYMIFDYLMKLLPR